MKLIILLGIFIFLTLKTLYKALKGKNNLKFSRRIKTLSRVDSRNKSEEKYLKTIFEILPIKHSTERIAELEKELSWVGSDTSAYKFILKPYIYFGASILFGVLLAYIARSSKIVSYSMISLGVVIGIISFNKNSIELKTKQIEKRNKIILEMPRLIKTIQFSPKNKSLDNILEDYLKHAKSGLKQDLELLLADIRAGIEENIALKRLSNRVNIPEVTELVSVLQLTGINSIDSTVSLQFLGTKFREKTYRIVEKELSNRPEKLSVLNDILLNLLVLLILVPVAIKAFSGITNILK